MSLEEAYRLLERYGSDADKSDVQSGLASVWAVALMLRDRFEGREKR